MFTVIVRKRLLWIDGSAAAVAGAAVLLVRVWLTEWYRLPQDLLVFIGVVNLAYASYSLSLAARPHRPMWLILTLVAANLMWSVVCIILAVAYRETATLFGLAHLIGEALFVAGLASLEWRWRQLLRTA